MQALLSPGLALDPRVLALSAERIQRHTEPGRQVEPVRKQRRVPFEEVRVGVANENTVPICISGESHTHCF